MSAKILNSSEAPSRAKQKLKTGDVLVSMTRPNLNAVAIISPKLDGAIGSTGFHVLRSKWVEPKFLFYLVQTQQFVEELCRHVQGALYPAVRPSDISSFKFLLPSSLSQTRIVEKLEELLSDLDAGVAELKAAQKKLTQYRQSLLKAAVEGTLTAEWRAERAKRGEPLETGAQLLERILAERRRRWEEKHLTKFKEQGKTPPKDWRDKYPEPVKPNTADLPELPEGWIWVSVDQICPEDIANGRSVVIGNGPKVLRLTAIRESEVDIRETKQGNWSEEEAAPFYIHEDDLLIVRGNGSLSLVGRAGLVGKISDQIAYPDTIIRIRIIQTLVRPAWISLLWDSMHVRNHLERRARTSAGIYKVAQSDIVSVPVPIPPIEEQDYLIDSLNKSKRRLQDIEATIAYSLKQSSAQRQNILKAAFSGQLVPQDPNDEPASVLLERIRAERAARESGGKRRGRKAKDDAA